MKIILDISDNIDDAMVAELLFTINLVCQSFFESYNSKTTNKCEDDDVDFDSLPIPKKV